MSKESLGYVKLEWNCPKCGGRNPGPEKTCLSCGAPQPENVQFVQAADQQMISDEKEITQAKAGPDIHCAFCGARNPAGTIECNQCGANLAEGTKREAGKVIGAYQTGQVKQIACPNCGQMNPETVLRCPHCGANTRQAPAAAPAAASPTAAPKGSKVGRIALFAILGLVLVCIIVFVALSFRTDASTGTVQNVAWETIIAIEALQPVTYQAWWDQIPAQATPGSCASKVRYVQDEPAPNANKVCGTPYTVDKGSGFAEVVQDCQYEVFEDFCDYTVMEWSQVDEARRQGSDFSPVWPEPQLAAGQRLGDQTQDFTVYFQTSDGQESYSPASLNEFLRFEIGSQWILNINTFGAVLSVEPAP